ELACMAIDTNYRGGDRGQVLLRHIEKQSSHMGLQTLFVLTTASSHWFIENGFVAADLAELPTSRQSLYNFQRSSKVFSKALL
ncbi:MAG: amino-acid N-acetyltransferase, partial [Saprospiraceae bacterium]